MNSQQQAVKQAYIDFLNSPEFARVLNLPPPRSRALLYVISIILALTLVGIPMAIGLLVRDLLRADPAEDARDKALRVARHAHPIVTCPLMYNSTLSEPGTNDAPALVIGTFDEAVKPADVAAIMERIEASLDKSDPNESERFLDAMMEDEEYKADRRRLLPRDITNGRDVYVFDMVIQRKFLPGGKLDVAFLPCMATPGPTGTITMIPCWVALRALKK